MAINPPGVRCRDCGKPGEVQQLKELLPALIEMLDGYVEATHPIDLVGKES